MGPGRHYLLPEDMSEDTSWKFYFKVKNYLQIIVRPLSVSIDGCTVHFFILGRLLLLKNDG